jgi:hypothetical protein
MAAEVSRAPQEIDKRFVEYPLELSYGRHGTHNRSLSAPCLSAIAYKSQNVGLQQLQYVGARMPSVIGREVVIFPLGHP